ncbi:hypothetical protein BDC45DRAFT_529285 [Circinella umbellata]|nr:hypothetical protein BDC45DRAFT_529285 [Circinella umbellata]
MSHRPKDERCSLFYIFTFEINKKLVFKFLVKNRKGVILNNIGISYDLVGIWCSLLLLATKALVQNFTSSKFTASITAIGNQAQRSVRLLKSNDSTTEESDDESSAEDEDVEDGDESSEMEEEAIEDETSSVAEKNGDDNYVSKVRNMAIKKLLNPKYKIDDINIPEEKQNNNIRHILLKKSHSLIKQDSIDFLSTELLKLSLSNILNFNNPHLRNMYQSFIPSDTKKKITDDRQKKKDEIEFDGDMNMIIDEVLDQLEPYVTTSNTDMLHIVLFTLRIFFTSVRNFRFWKGASPKSELSFLRKFEELLDVILDDTKEQFYL